MADPTDPLGILEKKAKQLRIINGIYHQIKEASGDVAVAAASFTEEQKKAAAQMGLIAERNETIVEAEKLLDEMYKKRAINAKDINEQLNINKKIRDDELKTAQERLLQLEKNYKLAKERQKILIEEDKQKAQLLIKIQKEFETTKAQLKLDEAQGRLDKDAREEKLRDAKILKQRREEAVGMLGEQLKTVEKIIDETEELLQLEMAENEAIEKRNKGSDSIISGLDKMIEQTGFFGEKWKEGPLGGIIDFIDSKEPAADLLDNLALKMEKISFKNLSAGVLTAIFEQTLAFMLQFDKLTGEFRKNTGIISKGFSGMEQRIVNVQRANIKMGVSMDEAFGAQSALISSMASFTSMAGFQQQQVLKSTVLLQEFGVSADTTAQIFNTFSKGLGYNADQLEKLSTQLMGISKSLKIPPQIIATEFNAATKELMKYGDGMMDVFKGLAEQSKQTGIAMGELLGIVKQFDTFEGAGEAVGKLNAILGGPYLNSINMLYASEEERVKMLRESIAVSGRQFDQLARFEQQAIAAAAGITDMSVAARLFGGTESEFASTQMSMKEMQKRAQEAQAVQEKFTQVMQSFAIAMGPVVDAIAQIMDALLVLMDPINSIGDLLGRDPDDGTRGILQGVAIAIYGVIAATRLMKYAWMKTMGPIALGVGVFILLTELMKNMSTGGKILLGILVGIAGAIALTKAAAFGFQEVGTFAVKSAAIGAIAAGSVTALSGLGEAQHGKKKGQKAGGDATLVAENGEEMVITESGERYLVDSPSVVELGAQDEVLSNADTRAAGGAPSSAALKPLLSALQLTLTQLTSAINAANAPQPKQKSNQDVIIKLDKKIVGQAAADWIKKKSNLRLA